MGARRLILALLIALAAAPLHGELWDRDTVSGYLDSTDVAAGAIIRNPLAYYRFRIDAAEKAEKATSLYSHDDLAVACYRLGRVDDALLWILRKQELIDDSARWMWAELRNDYRFKQSANRGTILALLVLRGLSRNEAEDRAEAEKSLLAALKLQPDALDEKLLLDFLRWTASSPKASADVWPNFLGLSGEKLLEQGGFDQVDENSLRKTVRVLSRWISRLGLEEDLDLQFAFLMALEATDDKVPADLTRMRLAEMMEAGVRSRATGPNGARNPVLKPLWDNEEWLPHLKKLRADAVAWNKLRSVWLEVNLAKGRHPDINEDFWTGFSPLVTQHEPADEIIPAEEVGRWFYLIWAGAIVMGMFVLAALVFFLARRHRASPSMDEV